MKTINFELSSPVKYADPRNTGTEVECTHIELREPTGNESHLCAALSALVKSAVFQAAKLFDDEIAEAGKQPSVITDAEDIIDGDGFMHVLEASGADMEKITLHAKEVFKTVAYMGGERAITSARLNAMSYRDLRKMIGVYLANFINN